MKTGKIQYLLIIAAICIFAFSSCKKDNLSSILTGPQVAQVQNSDVQDAVADKSDQDVDNTMDALQTNNYQPTTLKEAMASGTRVITVDHPDSTTFPKLVKIVYTNWQDSVGNESFVKNGEIDIYVTSEAIDRQKVTRVFAFKKFSVTTDSTIVTVNGTRTVARTAHTQKLTGGISNLRLSATDYITANMSFAIVKTGQTDSLKFTRIVDKARTSILYYVNAGGSTWATIKFRNNLAKDTITYSGTVAGVNEKGDNYSKTISEATPLVVIFYHDYPVLSSGTMQLTVTGTTTASFTITFKQDLPNHPFATLVTVTNNVTMKSRSFDRRYGGKFIKWW